MRRAETLLLGAGAALSFALLGYGIAQRAAAPAVTELVGSAPAPPAPTKTAVGSLVYEGVAPTPDATPADALCAGCDVVLITVCSLRQDHVGAYGVHPGLTPRIDALAARGFRFGQAYAASNFTLAGLTAILTGRYGSTTGVTGWDKGLTADVPTLPEVLQHYGYTTAAFTIDAPSGFRPDYGLHRGFSRMEIIPPPRDTPDGRTGAGTPGEGGDSARPVAKWLDSTAKDGPVFVMFHTRTAHFPFVLEPPKEDPTGILALLYAAGNPTASAKAMPGTAGGTAQRGVVAMAGKDPLQVAMEQLGARGEEAWRAAYAASVARMDVDVGVVLDAVERRGKRTVVMLVADHGESLNDHGELLHGDAYWDTVVRVPLVMAIVGGEGPVGTSDALVSHVDLAPTLLEAVGAVSPTGIDGASALPLLRGEGPLRATTLVEGGVAWRDSTVPRGAVIAPPWALLRQDRGCGAAGEPPHGRDEPASCLYDMVGDPGQTRNAAREHPEVVAELLTRWDTFRAARAGEARQLTLDPAYVEELHKTGYDFRTPEPSP